MPTVLRVGPNRFFFYSNENQEPEHIHVESGDGSAKFWLTPVRLAGSDGLDTRTIRRLQAIVEEHRETLVKAWNDYFKG